MGRERRWILGAPPHLPPAGLGECCNLPKRLHPGGAPENLKFDATIETSKVFQA